MEVTARAISFEVDVALHIVSKFGLAFQACLNVNRRTQRPSALKFDKRFGNTWLRHRKPCSMHDRVSAFVRTTHSLVSSLLETG